ncbi:sensor histidine kinase [Chloroflexota bacterium]
MFKNEEYYNRIDDLFADQEPLETEPSAGSPADQVDQHLLEGILDPFFQNDPVSGGNIRNGEIGWEQYLNAIDREENLGFSFDHETLQLLRSNGNGKPKNGDSDRNVIKGLLQVGDVTLGNLQLEGDTDWGEDDTKLVKAIAQQVSQHVENLRLLEQAQQYRAEAERASKLLTHEGWEAYLQSPSTPWKAFTYDQNKIVPIDPDNPDPSTEITKSASVIAGALKVRDEEIGRIVLADPEKDPGTVENLLSITADRLGVHIENLRLLDETEQSRQQLDKRATELGTVSKVSTAVATTLEPKALMQSVVDLTTYSFKLYLTSIFLLNETGDLLDFTAGSGKIGHAIVEERFKIGVYQKNSIIAKAARTREIVIVSDAQEEPDFLQHPLLPDVRSEVAIPLIVGEQLVGVFDIMSDRVGSFTEEDAQTFTTLASQTAIALRNAQLYAEQMQTVARLRELDRLKSSFLANMSHELRTPLNSILGFAQVILEGIDGPLTEEMEMDLGLIEKNGQHLLNLINEVLDMAKIESGRISLSLESIILADMLEDVINTSRPLVRGDVVLVNDYQFSDDMVIMADVVRLRQMLLNIIGNALKFTEQGSVKIEAEQLDEKVQIRVVDTGIGIPPDKLESIFEAFSQVDTSTTRKVGGTGLGLPISRRLAEMHGGWLWSKSEGIPGEGATFYLDLPVGDVE